MAFLHPYLGFRIFECVLGIVCFGLFTYYGLAFPVNYINTEYMLRVKFGIGFVAADAFPFIVQMPFLIAGIRHGRKFNYNILNPMMALAGCVVYLTAGAMSITYVRDVCSVVCWSEISAPWYAVGSMFVITGCVYFFDLIFWCVKLRKGGNDID